MLDGLMKIKEPFLLIFSLLWIAFLLLPASFYRRRNGEPYDDLLIRRIAFAGIGIALLVAWYALPPK
jgi:succinate-acetate transporter protein